MMAKEFKIKDLGMAEYILGISIDQTISGYIFLSQETFIKQSLVEIGLEEAKPLSLPISGGDLEIEARLFDNESKDKDIFENPMFYRSMVGKLMYVMVTTRPDIAFATNFASCFMQHPIQKNLSYVRRI